MTADEVKDALRGRHPAIAQFGGPGAWTCLEEWMNVDLLAFSAWSSTKPPIVGYEVKVSRSDYRRELLRPSKRAAAVACCWQFYFATPKGLLTKEEKAYVQPEHFEDGSAFVRESCPEHCRKLAAGDRKLILDPTIRMGTGDIVRSEQEARQSGKWRTIDAAFGDAACRFHRALGEFVTVKDSHEEFDPSDQHWRAGGPRREWTPCSTCEGCGYLQQSVVEQEAPTLWIPPDVGLIEVNPDTGKCRTVRKAPLNPPTDEFTNLGGLIRWASFRPDPRHLAERERLEKSE